MANILIAHKTSKRKFIISPSCTTQVLPPAVSVQLLCEASAPVVRVLAVRSCIRIGPTPQLPAHRTQSLQLGERENAEKVIIQSKR
jgi:hypothetical protein